MPLTDEEVFGGSVAPPVMTDADVFGTTAPAQSAALPPSSTVMSDADVFGTPAGAKPPGLTDTIAKHVSSPFDIIPGVAAAKSLGQWSGFTGPGNPLARGFVTGLAK